MLEIMKDLYIDEETLESDAGLARVKADLTRLIATVRDYAREKAGGRYPGSVLRPGGRRRHAIRRASRSAAGS